MAFYLRSKETVLIMGDIPQLFKCTRCAIEKDKTFYYESRLRRNCYICRDCSINISKRDHKNNPAVKICKRLRYRKTPLPLKVVRALLEAFAAESIENKRAVEAATVDMVARDGGLLSEHNAAVVMRSWG